MEIDINKLRNDLIDFFGTAIASNPLAQADLIKVENASPQELINIALSLPDFFDLSDYEITKGFRF